MVLVSQRVSEFPFLLDTGSRPLSGTIKMRQKGKTHYNDFTATVTRLLLLFS